MAKVKDYYEILGVSRDASVDDIKKSYRKLARKCHPDLNPGDKTCEERFKELSEAYAVLSDPKKREEYDSFGKSPFEGRGFDFRGRDFEDAFGFGFGDIFSDIFGAGAPEARARPLRGADIVSSIAVSLEEAFSGVKKRMNVMREVPCGSCRATGVESSTVCAACKGSGRVQTSKGFFRVASRCAECGGTGSKVTKVCQKCNGQGKTYSSDTIDVKIPAGVEDDSFLRLRGMGSAGSGGGPNGDLRLRVSVRPHPLFERKGADIHLKLPVTFGEVALGAKVEVPTIDGKAMMTIPPGTQGGQRFKMSGKGFTRPGGGARGDMFVDTVIAVPKGLSASEKEAVEMIEAAYPESPRKGLMRK